MNEPFRVFSLRSAATLCCLALLTVAVPVAGAAESAAANDIPRTPSGRPDLSGTYDTATLTPVVRPPQYGNRLELSKEEADAIAEHWRQSFEKDHTPSDPNREAPPEGGTDIYAPEFTGAAGKVGGYNAFFVDIGDNAFELDGKFRTSIMTDPPDGRYPPLTAEGERRQAEAALFRHENTGTAWWLDLGLDFGPYDDPEVRPLAERCLLARGAAGPPSLPSMYNNIKRIVQTDDYVMLNVEWMHDTRVIPIGVEREPEAMPTWLGQAIGHWEGDTLVVETTNFLEVPADKRISRDLRVVERFSRIDADTLRYQFTVHDPRYSAPWSGEYPWPSAEGRMYEYACHEGNYALGGILRGARLLENEALDGKNDSDD